MEFKIYFKLFLLINFLQIFGINGQSDKCTVVTNPKSYSDCGIYNNLPTSTICCFIRGVYGGNNGTACIPVDMLFANKSVSLTTNGSTGTMICGANVSSETFIKTKFSFFICLIIFLFVLF